MDCDIDPDNVLTEILSMFLSEYSPIEFVVTQNNPCVLAVIIDRTGPGYRNIGSMMAFSSEGERNGSLSSGCIEDDLWLSSKLSLERGKPIISQYGAESKIFDLKLPCGGGMTVLILPRPNKSILREILKKLGNRSPIGVSINLLDGLIKISNPVYEATKNNIFNINLMPETQFLVMGTGAETHTFCLLSLAAGFKVKLLSPDLSLIKDVSLIECDGYHLPSFDSIPELAIDCWTAIILFFHDNDWEPLLLKRALKSNAFYIGAQGSKSAHFKLLSQLKNMGVKTSELSRLEGQIGLIPSARNPKILAISVLADVINKSIKQ